MRHDSHFVDQLSRADELPIGRRIGIHLIEANPDQPRSNLGDLTDLKASIAHRGVLEPILVRKREDGRFTIISGERRFRASLEAGLTEIPCIEMDVDGSDLLEIALIENLQRKDLTPFEEADGYAALQLRYGYTHEQIAKSVGKSRVTITETLRLSSLPMPVKDECRRADIESKSFLLELSRLESEEAMLRALEAYVSGDGRSRDDLRAQRRDTDDPDRTTVPVKLPKSYELRFQPEGLPYNVSVVLRGSLATREEILGAVKDLARRIEAGEIDLENHGRFAKSVGGTPETS
jgi:ParB family transcriptional regulator, chromosome partitioning protein